MKFAHHPPRFVVRESTPTSQVFTTVYFQIQSRALDVRFKTPSKVIERALLVNAASRVTRREQREENHMPILGTCRSFLMQQNIEKASDITKA